MSVTTPVTTPDLSVVRGGCRWYVTADDTRGGCRWY